MSETKQFPLTFRQSQELGAAPVRVLLIITAFLLRLERPSVLSPQRYLRHSLWAYQYKKLYFIVLFNWTFVLLYIITIFINTKFKWKIHFIAFYDKTWVTQKILFAEQFLQRIAIVVTIFNLKIINFYFYLKESFNHRKLANFEFCPLLQFWG